MKRNRNLVAVLATAAVSLAISASPASAGLLVESAENCEDASISKPFKPWLDYMNYVPAPDGGFEAGADGWTLSGAKVVAGNETYDVGGSDDSSSLHIPAGGSATSPVMCVGIGHPTMRLFTKSSKSLLGLSLATLKVEVLFEGSGGGTHSLPIGVVPALRSWTPSLPMPVLANLLPLLPGEQTPVAFRFTAVGNASWTIDDVYVDPWKRG